MADPTEDSPQPQASARPSEDVQALAGPSGAQLSPGRRPRRARFERSPTPSPSRDRNQGDGRNLQDELLDALIVNDLPRFRELVPNKKIDKKYKYGRPHHSTCLEIACRRPDRGEFVKELLEYVKPNINKVIPEPIHYAAERGHDDSLRVLLVDKRTKVYALNSKGQTALHLACANVTADHVDKYSRCIELLVPKMSIADLNKPDCNGFTPFHTLVRGPGKKQSVKRKQHFMDVKGNEDQSSEAGEERGVEDRSRGEDDMQARERLAELLLRMTQGALDVDSVRTKGRTAREDAELRFPNLHTLLPARREQPRADPHMALVNALRDGRIELFRALLQQIDADGNPALDPNYLFGYPLHTTCLEMACEMADGAEFVQALLEAGADPNVPNQLSEKYPIHMACEKGHYKELEALLKYSKIHVDVNCEDKSGNTPLHCTVDRISDDKRRETGRRKCLEILLKDDTLDVKRPNKDGNTALLLAVHDGNKAVIKTFLGSKNHFKDLDLQTLSFRVGDRSLRDTIAEQFPQLSELLQRPDTMDTLQCRRGERTKLLFENLNPIREEDFVRQLGESRPRDLAEMNDKKFTLLQRAARYGLVKAARALLEAGVDPNRTFSGNPTPPGVIASYHRHVGILQILVEERSFKINATDAKGNTALHYATRADKNMETVILLLRHGADMTIRNKLGKSPFGKEQVESLLDQCVKTNGKNALEEDYELILDYRLLAPRPHPECVVRNRYIPVPLGDGRNENGVIRQEKNPQECKKLVSEMDFLNMMSNDEDLSALLDHPVALSFLQLKWNRLKFLSYFNLVVYMLFMIFLNTYIILVTQKISSTTNKSLGNSKSGDKTNDKINHDVIVLGSLTLFFWMFLTLRELTQFLLDTRKYMKSWENYLDLAVLIFTLVSLFLPFMCDMKVARTVNVLTIMLSCFELLLLLGRVSYFAKYIEMLKVVIKNYLLPLLSYSVIVVAFGLSFHTLCYECSTQNVDNNTEQQNSYNSSERINGTKEEDSADFGSWYISIVAALVMMIGELELDSLSSRSPQFIILFVLFVLLVTIVLLNLLTGLAVRDTATIEDAAQQLRLRSRVGVVLRSERVLVNMHNSECAALRCLPVPCCVRARLRRAAVLFPGATLEGRENRVKPNHTGEMALGGGEGERRWMERESLDRATQIISRRGAAAAQALTLADVDARVQEVLKELKLLEARFTRTERRVPLLSEMSVFSEIALENTEPDAPTAEEKP